MKKIEVLGSRDIRERFGIVRYGTYSPDCTRQDVEKLVRGSFGGCFTKFENGQFEYIPDAGD